jgi:hypothetical protein
MKPFFLGAIIAGLLTTLCAAEKPTRADAELAVMPFGNSGW